MSQSFLSQYIGSGGAVIGTPSSIGALNAPIVYDGATGTKPGLAADVRTYLGIDTDDTVTFGDLTVNNLVVNGMSTTVHSSVVTVDDPLIRLGDTNPADSLDLGFYGKYISGGIKYTGLFRDATDNKYKLYSGLQTEPTTTVDILGAGYVKAVLVADIEGTVNSVTLSSGAGATNFLSGSGVYGAVPYSSLSGIPGSFVPSTHATTHSSGGSDPISHNNLAGLTAGDPHTQYALLLGRATGQSLAGGTGSGENLELVSTTHATKGKIFFGAAHTTAYDGVNDRIGIGTGSPSSILDISGVTPFVKISASSGTSALIGLYQTTTLHSLFGLNLGGPNSLITGSVDYDFCIRNNNHKIIFSSDAGTTLHVSIGPTGLVGINKGTAVSTLDIVTKSASTIGGIIAGSASQSVSLLQLNHGSTPGASANFLSCTSNGGVEGDLGRIVSTGHIRGIDGTATIPAFSFINSTNCGMSQGIGGNGRLSLIANGSTALYLDNANGAVSMPSGTLVGWVVSGDASSSSVDTSFARAAPAEIRFGKSPSNAPVAQTLSVQGALTGGTNNTAGVTWIFRDSAATGNAASGGYAWQTSDATVSGNGAQAFTTKMSLNSAGTLSVKTGGYKCLGPPSGTGYSIRDGGDTTTTALLDGGNGVTMSKNHGVFWGSGFSISSTDLGILRSSAGVAEITANSTGVYRDLKLRSILPIAMAATDVLVTVTGFASQSVSLVKLNHGSTPGASANFLSCTSSGGAEGDKFAIESSGLVHMGVHSAIAAETVTGYITIKDAAGNSRKLAVVS